jgi:hypothetical protein
VFLSFTDLERVETNPCLSSIPIDARNGISDPFGTVPVRVEENKPSGSVEDLVF